MLDAQLHDAILELRLARPPVNALNPALVATLRDAVIGAPGRGARAIVLSGNPGLFSAGLDVPSLLALDRAGMAAFWRDFIGLLGALGRSPLPIAAAITGHSPAGGAVLALFCDWRVMARAVEPAKPFRIGLNEVQVGLSVPWPIQFALRRLVGAHRAERMMVAGAMVDSEEALRTGFVDELTDVDQVVPRAHAWCRQHLALPQEAMAETRRMARSDLHEALDRAQNTSDDEFMARWFSDESQSVLKALVAKLKSKA
jgi:enoyl-CoA hydratase/carnithine racemase